MESLRMVTGRKSWRREWLGMIHAMEASKTIARPEKKVIGCFITINARLIQLFKACARFNQLAYKLVNNLLQNR